MSEEYILIYQSKDVICIKLASWLKANFGNELKVFVKGQELTEQWEMSLNAFFFFFLFFAWGFFSNALAVYATLSSGPLI